MADIHPDSFWRSQALEAAHKGGTVGYHAIPQHGKLLHSTIKGNHQWDITWKGGGRMETGNHHGGEKGMMKAGDTEETNEEVDMEDYKEDE